MDLPTLEIRVQQKTEEEPSQKRRKNGGKRKKNCIGVQSLMVMPSKLWRFEWSERGTIVVSILVKMKEVTFKLPKMFFLQIIL